MMWMMHLLPDSFLILIIHALLVTGLIGMVIGFIGGKLPFVGTYATIIKIVSIVLFCIGLYWKGGYSVEEEWQQRVAEMEEKVRIAEEKSKETNVIIETKYKDRVKKITETRNVIVEKIKINEKIIDAKCELDPVVISILNEAAKKP
jgi:membrane protein implicated in regulation of membrane protease activity